MLELHLYTWDTNGLTSFFEELKYQDNDEDYDALLQERIDSVLQYDYGKNKKWLVIEESNHPVLAFRDEAFIIFNEEALPKVLKELTVTIKPLIEPLKRIVSTQEHSQAGVYNMNEMENDKITMSRMAFELMKRNHRIVREGLESQIEDLKRQLEQAKTKASDWEDTHYRYKQRLRKILDL